MTIHIENLSELDNPALRDENPDVFGVSPVSKPTSIIPKIIPLSGLSEADLQKEIVSFLQEQGYKVLVTGKARLKRNGKDTYVTPYQADGKGWPDIAAFNPEAKYKAIALELKSSNGKTSPEQVGWLLTLSKCGVLTGIVTPATWEQMKVKITEAQL